MNRFVLLSSCALSLAAGCGGKVVFDGSQGGAGAGNGNGNGSTTASGTLATSATTGVGVTVSTATGAGPCDDHADCGPGELCLFAQGTCARECTGEFCESCDAGTLCDGCATSSCPQCADCRAACVPALPGQCDDDDPCPPGTVCLHGQNSCAPVCGPNGSCAEPGFFCAECVTGSCCGCDNCVSACIPGD